MSDSAPLAPDLAVAALIPAYREERHIAAVVQGSLAQVDEVWVVDDGSPDQTAARAEAAGAKVIRHPTNCGKGAAIKAGLKMLLDRGVQYVVLLDGDGQHRPGEIGRFLEAAQHSGAKFVLGNRFGNLRDMPFIRRLTNRYMSHVISRLAGAPIPDTQCGFRLLHRDLIPLVLGESNRFDFETEMILLASSTRCKIESVPISTIYGEERSKIHPWHDTIRFLRLMKKWKKRRYGRSAP